MDASGGWEVRRMRETVRRAARKRIIRIDQTAIQRRIAVETARTRGGGLGDGGGAGGEDAKVADAGASCETITVGVGAESNCGLREV